MRVPEQFKEFYEAAIRQDWTVTKGSHGLKWLPPNGQPMVVSPSSTGGIRSRTVNNVRQKLRQSGLILPGTASPREKGNDDATAVHLA